MIASRLVPVKDFFDSAARSVRICRTLSWKRHGETLTLLNLPVPLRCPREQKIGDGRGKNTRHKRPGYEWPEERFQDEVCIRKPDFIPSNMRSRNLAARYLDAEPEAKPVQRDNRPRVVDKSPGYGHQFAHPEHPGKEKTAQRVQADGRREGDEHAEGKRKSKLVRRVIERQDGADSVSDIFHVMKRMIYMVSK